MRSPLEGKLLKFSAAAIRQYDWEAILPYLKDVQTILEFGAGISTKLFTDIGKTVTSLETKEKWIRVCKMECPDVEYHLWDNEGFPEAAVREYDLVFVDGALPRDKQMEFAEKLADKVIIHDVDHEEVGPFIDDYFSNWKECYIEGRCACFVRDKQ